MLTGILHTLHQKMKEILAQNKRVVYWINL